MYHQRLNETEDGLALANVKLTMATQDATLSALNLVETLNSIRNRYTVFGWFLYRLGIL